MFYLVISRYLQPAAALDAAMADHQLFLDACYRQGVFILSGPKLPRDGGIILAVTATREELIAVLEQDPFRARGLIDYDVLQWNLNRRAATLPETVFPDSRITLTTS